MKLSRRAVRLLLASVAVLGTPAILAFADEVESWEYRGDGLVLKFHEQGTGHGGSITIDGKVYPFTGTIKDGVLSGTFAADGQSFPFTMKTTDDAASSAVLESGGTTYKLKEGKAEVPVPPVPKRPPPMPAEPEAPVPAVPEPPKPMDKPEPVRPPAPQPQQGAGAPGRIVLEKRAVVDKQTQLPIFTVLTPQGWQLASETVWRVKLLQWVTAFTQTVDPQTGTAVRWLPLDQFAADSSTLKATQQQGLPPVTGAGYELVAQAMTPEQYLTQIVLPRYRRVPGMKVVGYQDLASLQREAEAENAQSLAMWKQGGVESKIQAGKIRIEYPGPGGNPIEEDVYVALLHTWQPRMIAMAQQVGLPGVTYFKPARAYSFAAPKGQLDAASSMLQVVLDSARITPKWDAFVMSIEQMRRQAAIDDNRIATAARAEVTAQQQQAWEQRMESQDHIAQGRGDNLSGVHRFIEPTDPAARVILPDTYKQAWSDGQGHYIVSNEVNYDPRQDRTLNGTWQEMQPQQ
jgi:hypothetical protein